MMPQIRSLIASGVASAPLADALLRLDRKIARAIQTQKGINVKPAELDLLALVGAVDLLGEARSAIMKDNAQSRYQIAPASTQSASAVSVAGAISPPVRASTSAKTNGCSDAARARLVFG